MKLIARALAILAAALVVVGVTSAISQTSYAQSLFPARPNRPALSQLSTNQVPPSSTFSSATTNAPALPTARQAAPSGERQGGISLFGALEVLSNAVIIGTIIAVVSLAKRLWFRVAGRGEKSKDKRLPNVPSTT